MTSFAERMARLPAENRRYTLEALARHLADAQQHVRLRTLFASDEWMHLRFEGSGYQYDGYLADLAIAWGEVAHPEAIQQAEQGQIPLALADCVRYALIRTSVNSIAADYRPHLVTQAVRTGFWSPERAISHARNIPDHVSQAAMSVALLETGRLIGLERREVEDLAFSAASAAENPSSRRTVLASLASVAGHPLASQALALALESVHELDYESWRADAIVELAPHLSNQLAAEGLCIAQELDEAGPRARALASLLPRLLDDQVRSILNRELHTLKGSEDSKSLAEALEALAPYLDGDLPEQALDVIEDITDGWYQGQVLAALAPGLAGDLAERALAIAVCIEHPSARIDALSALLPLLPAQSAARGMESGLAAARTPEGQWRSDVHRLLLYMADADRIEVLSQEVRDVRTSPYPWLQAQSLASLAPYLDGVPLVEALEAALELPEGDMSRVLSTLAPHLTSDLAVQARQAATSMVNEHNQAEVLVALIPHVGTQQVPEVSAMAATMADPYAAAHVWVALAARQDWPGREQALESGLKACLSLPAPSARSRELIRLLPYLTGPRKVRALEAALEATLAIREPWLWSERLTAEQELAPVLTGALLDRALAASTAIGDGWSRLRALARFAPWLESGQRIQALKLCLQILEEEPGDDMERVQALHVVAPRLEGNLLARGLELGLGLEEDEWIPEAIAELAPFLDRELLEAGLDRALSLSDERFRATALVALAPHLEGELLARCQEAAHSLDSVRERGRVLAVVAPQLEGRDRSRAQAQAWRAMDQMDDETKRQTLSAVAPYLTGIQLRKALDLAAAMQFETDRAGLLVALAPRIGRRLSPRGLAIACALEEPSMRVQALMSLLPGLSGRIRQEVLDEALNTALDISHSGSRLHALAQLAPHLPRSRLVQAVEAVWAVDESMERAQALAALLPFLEDELQGLTDIRHTLVSHLQTLQSERRDAVLGFCADDHLFAPPIVGEAAVQRIAAGIIEITWNWHW